MLKSVYPLQVKTLELGCMCVCIDKVIFIDVVGRKPRIQVV